MGEGKGWVCRPVGSLVVAGVTVCPALTTTGRRLVTSESRPIPGPGRGSWPKRLVSYEINEY